MRGRTREKREKRKEVRKKEAVRAGKNVIG